MSLRWSAFLSERLLETTAHAWSKRTKRSVCPYTPMMNTLRSPCACRSPRALMASWICVLTCSRPSLSNGSSASVALASIVSAMSHHFGLSARASTFTPGNETAMSGYDLWWSFAKAEKGNCCWTRYALKNTGRLSSGKVDTSSVKALTFSWSGRLSQHGTEEPHTSVS